MDFKKTALAILAIVGFTNAVLLGHWLAAGNYSFAAVSLIGVIAPIASAIFIAKRS